jgi:hypothetical protein
MMIIVGLVALDMVVSWFRIGSLVERTKEPIGGELKDNEFFLAALLGVIELVWSGAKYIPVQSVNQLHKCGHHGHRGKRTGENGNNIHTSFRRYILNVRT